MHSFIHKSKNFTNSTHGIFNTGAAWTAKKKELLTPNKAKDDPPYRRYKATSLNDVVNARISKLAAQAADALAAFNTANQTREQVVFDINNYLTAARNGGKNTADDAVSAFATRNDACSTAGGTAAVKSLSSDVACICSSVSASHICGHSVTSTAYQGSQQNAESDAKNVWDAVKTTCKGKTGQRPPTATELLAAISAFKAELGTQATGVVNTNILGSGASADYTGNTAAAHACLNYARSVSVNGIAGIQWVGNILSAAAAIRKGEQTMSQMQAAAARVGTLTTAAWGLYDSLAAAEVISGLGPQQAADKPIDKAATDEECNSAGDNEYNCKTLKDKDCVFNKEAKKCELKKVKAEL
ncbi:variant surface glycoprotein [Trypanosoma brucei equiperdum]|uniref:Variant surface glycoprotein n=1 Tax=Trypanosoma brucei equiperdum TaxID=630700 RepID=A0A3L6LBH7_9TRYP|nr:variant surface glycoprotein [Trypanosoma brucei equiperdum]RHW73683.1 variant surface glycoprotein [Trypanosoma brucei equiperdum]RHW73812.1 variant surface glycoprotein [Trypanosoma brucei equiperdum]